MTPCTDGLRVFLPSWVAVLGHNSQGRLKVQLPGDNVCTHILEGGTHTQYIKGDQRADTQTVGYT